jgi:predicted Rossmann-fold nucleotide-binding protein
MISSNSFNNLNEITNYFKQVPFDVTRKGLYSAIDLYEGYDPDNDETFKTCHDTKVYEHYMAKGKHASTVEESLARTLHDHGIHVALDKFFDEHDKLLCVGIMGGHAQLRTDKMYREIVFISKQLTEMGFFMLSGGGPGAMEATHLGAWMAGRSKEEVEDAIQMLTPSPSFRDEGWLSSAFHVMRKYPQDKYVSLGIPTWLYGHEPSTPFATHIAKFFENSIREDSILTLAYGGIIYTPGSAGTLQEIFQDAVQNHYLSFGFSSPMIFLGKDFWTKEIPIYSLLESLMQNGKYKNLILTVSDESKEIVAELMKFREKMKDFNQ